MRISDWSSDVCSSDLSGPAKKRKKSAAEPGGAGESEPDDAEQKDTSGPANETSEQIDDEELGVDDEKSSGDEGQVQSSANETQSSDGSTGSTYGDEMPDDSANEKESENTAGQSDRKSAEKGNSV